MCNNCPICYSSLENIYSIKTPCNHEFCLNCISKLKETICPICRKNIQLKNNYIFNLIEINNKKYTYIDFLYTAVPF